MRKDRAANAANQTTEVLDSVTSNTDIVVATVEANGIQKQTKPLTPAETKRLAEYEAIFEGSKKEFKKGYDALQRICEEGLYRATYSTFEQYCREKWGITARHANRLMLADAVVDNIKSDQLVSSVPAAIPENEGQTRPLQPLTKEQQVEAARLVAKKPGKHTAQDFECAAEKVAGKKPKVEKPGNASAESDEEKPRVKSYKPDKAPEPPVKTSSKPKDNGDLEKLMVLVDDAETQARKIAGCDDVVTVLHELGKTITRKLNGGAK
jgi:hypothetical protein